MNPELLWSELIDTIVEPGSVVNWLAKIGLAARAYTIIKTEAPQCAGEAYRDLCELIQQFEEST